MLTIEFEDAKSWIELLEAIRDIVEEAFFVATPEGLSLRAMDSARVAMVDLKLPSVYFSNYNIEKEEVKIGFSISSMVKILKGMRKGYKLTLELGEENLIKLRFIGKGYHTFEFPLLDIEGENIPSLKLKFDAKIKIETKVLMDAVENIEKFSDYATFKVESEKFMIYGKSEKGRATSEFSKEDLIELQFENEAISSYSTEYLLNILGKDNLSEITVIEFATKVPLKVTYNLENEGELVYYLAPRTETE
jgi:proliferating cell nuclear antigen